MSERKQRRNDDRPRRNFRDDFPQPVIQTGIVYSTFKEYVKDLKSKGRVRKNGNGKKVTKG